MERIPVVILSGFLGSGKTTLLIRLIADAKRMGLRPGILMNELGKQDVDGSTLHAADPELHMEKLFDGCICCDKKSEVVSSLNKLILQKPDVIFIELTGVANPEEIADSLTESLLIDRTALHHIVTVLDAEHVLEYNSIFSTDRTLVRTLRRQMEAAGFILLNKSDLVAEAKLNKITAKVRKYNPVAGLLYTKYSEMDNSLLLGDLKPLDYGDPAPAPAPASASASGSPRFQMQSGAAYSNSGHHHQGERPRSYSRLGTLELAYHTKLTAKQVEGFMKQLKGRLLRAKGYITLSGQNRPTLFQYSGQRTSWSSALYEGPEYVVLIGMDLDEPAIIKQWSDLK